MKRKNNAASTTQRRVKSEEIDPKSAKNLSIPSPFSKQSKRPKRGPKKQKSKQEWPESKLHPIINAGFITRLLFYWLHELIQISRKSVWSQKMHYHLPSFDRVKNHKPLLTTVYQKNLKKNSAKKSQKKRRKKPKNLKSEDKNADQRVNSSANEDKKSSQWTLYTTILKTYQFELTEFLLISITTTAIQFSTSLFTSSALSIVTKQIDIRNPKILNELIFDFLMVAFLDTLRSVINTYNRFKIQRVGLGVRGSLYSMIQDKVMEFNILADGAVTQGLVTNLVQIDALRASEALQATAYFVQKLLTPVIAFGFVGSVVGYRLMSISLGAYIAADLLNFVTFYLDFNITKFYLKAKDSRVKLFVNVLANLEHVKSKALENLYSLKLFRRREKEILQLKRISGLQGLDRVFSTFSEGFGLAVIFFYFSFWSEEKIEYSTFITFLSTFSTITFEIRSCVLSFFDLIKIFVSLRRLDQFFGASHEDDKYDLDRAKDSVKSSGRGSTDRFVAVEVRNGEFVWKKSAKEVESGEIEYLNFEAGKKKNGKKMNKIEQGKVEGAPENEIPLLKPNQNIKIAQSSENKKKLEINENQPKNAPKDNKGRQKGFSLHLGSLKIFKGEKIAVIGKNGSGKSSILYALIGEMLPLKTPSENPDGRSLVVRDGSAAFLSQNRWLFQDTIKRNILLGRKYNQRWMELALKASELEDDLKKLTKGISTVVSGAAEVLNAVQKARICLARCFYQDASIFLLDDPTQSLDLRSSRSVMNKICRTEPWKSKTVVYTTRDLRMVEYCDKVIYVEDGVIRFFGEPDELEGSSVGLDLNRNSIPRLSSKKSIHSQRQESQLTLRNLTEAHEFEKPFFGAAGQLNRTLATSALMQSQLQDEMTEAGSQMPQNLLKPNQKQPKTKEMNSEDRASGIIPLQVINRVIKGSGGYLWLLAILLTGGAAKAATFQRISYTLSWGEAYFNFNLQNYNLAYNALLMILLELGLNSLFGFLIYLSLAWLMRKMHAKMVFKILHCRSADFVQKTSLGVILNRLTYDIDVLDNELPYSLAVVMTSALGVFSDFYAVFAGVQEYYSLIPCFVFLVAGLVMRSLYMSAKREMARLNAISRSPVIDLVSSTIRGSAIIRSFGAESYFQKNLSLKIEENLKNVLIEKGLFAWFAANIALLNMVVLLIPLYSIMIIDLYENYENREAINYPDIANYIVTVIKFSGFFMVGLEALCEAEVNMVSAERCKYFEELPSEDGYQDLEPQMRIYEDLKNPRKLESGIERLLEESSRLDLQSIELEDVAVEYSTMNSAALSGLNLGIFKGEKVAVIGKSGSGKSTFLKLMYKAVVPTAGRVFVNGLEAGELDLKLLRKSVNLVSQKSTIFEGSLGANLSTSEGFTEAKEARIVADLVELGFPEGKLNRAGLDYWLESGGANVSESERKVIQMVACLLKDEDFVLLDAPTVLVDELAEKRFLEMLMSRFEDGTVIYTSPRLGNIKDYFDRVIVLQNGVVVEDERLGAETASRGSGYFSEMLKAED